MYELCWITLNGIAKGGDNFCPRKRSGDFSNGRIIPQFSHQE
jgi:hypothetical protein